jgi:signal transduction histidine kinase
VEEKQLTLSLGNALKYTPKGWVAVSLRAQESANPHKMDVVFRVVDSGKGMSENFQKNRLFTAFSQEDEFQPGLVILFSLLLSAFSQLSLVLDWASAS